MAGLVLGTSTALAQAPAGGTWTDPPARVPAAAAPSSPAASPAPAQPSVSVPPKAAVETSADAPPVASKPVRAAAPAVRTAAPTVRQAASPARPSIREARSFRAVKPAREARRSRPPVVAELPRARFVPARVAEPREIVRPVARRVVVRTYAPRIVAAQPYPYGPLPVGRVVGPTDGERNPIFEEGDDRTRRIAAAQAAGYLVVRARSVQFPDGRTVRSYRPYDEDDGAD